MQYSCTFQVENHPAARLNAVEINRHFRCIYFTRPSSDWETFCSKSGSASPRTRKRHNGNPKRRNPNRCTPVHWAALIRMRSGCEYWTSSLIYDNAKTDKNFRFDAVTYATFTMILHHSSLLLCRPLLPPSLTHFVFLFCTELNLLHIKLNGWNTLLIFPVYFRLRLYFALLKLWRNRDIDVFCFS